MRYVVLSTYSLMVRMVQAVSHPAVKKVFIESPVLHSAFAMQLSSYSLFIRYGLCSTKQADYLPIVVDEPRLLEV